MTGIGSAVAMVPFIVAGDMPGLEVARPLAVVVVCGLVTALALNLFVAPAAYLLLATSSSRQATAAPATVPAMPAAPLGTLITVLLLLVTACGPAPRKADSGAGDAQPARVVPIAGSALSQVLLTQEAVARLDVQTTAVRAADVGGQQRLSIPYSAVIYDVNGDAWAYTSPAPLTYVRQKLDIASIDDQTAILADGPAEGTQIVTVGGAELYGAEFEFQED